ncbi:MAG: alpha/beta fold hydrolase [Blastocatellia bacterium]
MEAVSTPCRSEPVNGIEMYFEIHGDGKPLVLLHGFTGCGSNWEPFISDLAREYQLIVPDLRGHGSSTNPSNSFTFRQSARDVFALLDRLEVESFKAIGVSGGAKTLLHMATHQPGRVEAMVLVSATPYFPPQARAIMRETTPENRSEEEWKMMRQWHKRGDEQIRALWLQGNRFKDSYDDMNFTPAYLSTITARTLIVHGDRDPFYPVELALEMYAAIARSHLWVIPNAGHGPIYADQKDAFIKTASAFLRGDWETGSSRD